MKEAAVFFTLVVLLVFVPLQARSDDPEEFDPDSVPCCEYAPYQQVVWYGDDPTMTIQQLVSYCAPILWFSPDEPLTQGAEGRDIRMPTAFPFEEVPDAPVAYYRVRDVLQLPDADPETVYVHNASDRGRSTIDLSQVAGVDLTFFFYYPSEEGFGGHKHDVEATEVKAIVWQRERCTDCPYTLVIGTVNCKAHGVVWYDNTLDVDRETRFPITVLVEEGKHAGCTDKNGDGYYTPGYDVNRRVNDAWGVRDVIRGGGLFSGGFESWFAKVRAPEDRVFPPLPEDSPLRARFTENGVYAPDHAKYELRPFPHPNLAADDPALVPFIADKGSPDWPDMDTATDLGQFGRWLTEESFVKSSSLAFRMDGDPGFSFVFPLFIFKNYSDPVAGGWLVNRIYLKDDNLRDFGYGVLYTTSASRWIDGYFSVGVEWDEDASGRTDSFWVAETGIKFRANIKHSPLRFLSKLTDFWGLRIGTQAGGLLRVDRLKYVVEFGAGTF